MLTKQVSIFLENKKGRLAEVTKLLTDEGINIRALALADEADFGVLRLIVVGRSAASAESDRWIVQVNGDTGSNYDGETIIGGAAATPVAAGCDPLMPLR